jgi:hypothetical protein
MLFTGESYLTHKYTVWRKFNVTPFEAEARLKIFKNSVRTSKRTLHFTITMIIWVMLFTDIVTVYAENHINPINTKYSITDC